MAEALCKDLPVAYIKARREDLLLSKRFQSESDDVDLDDVDDDAGLVEDDANELLPIVESEDLQTDTVTDTKITKNE